MDPLRIIASSPRLRILELVWDRELSAGEIARRFDVTWGAVSQHLTVLRSAGFIVERRVGNSRLYRADQGALGALRSVVEDRWRSGMSELKTLAEAEQREKDRDDGPDRTA